MPVYHWIGLTDERTGKWEWVNQTPYTMDRRCVPRRGPFTSYLLSICVFIYTYFICIYIYNSICFIICLFICFSIYLFYFPIQYIHYIYIPINIYISLNIYIYLIVFRKWKPNQPDNWMGSRTTTEDCAHLHSNGQLNDLHCFERLRYICQAHAHRV